MFRGISLANKCLLLFGGAVVLIILVALTLPALRMWKLVDEGQVQLSRELVDAWLSLDAQVQKERRGREGGGVVGDSALSLQLENPSLESARYGSIGAERIGAERAKRLSKADAFLAAAVEAFEKEPFLKEFHEGSWQGVTREYMYARAERSSGLGAARVVSIVVLKRQSIETFSTLWISLTFLLGAGAAVLALAVLVFYLVTHKIILQPVRALKETAERVREGNVAVRSDIKTGDEFEQLADTFNMMLTDLQTNQDRLRALNQAMDVKLHEMAESNTLLHEATKLKGEFLANVSHELRTPLNSIIGFAELLLEQAKSEAAGAVGTVGGGAEVVAQASTPSALGVSPPPASPSSTPPSVQRRIRYLSNIDTAGRNLLTHINSLLEMTRIEAGKIELKVERMNLRDACEGLLGLIHPLADRKGIELKLEVHDDVPTITTDMKKFQQIIFNFLSNAVKFSQAQEKTGRAPQISLRAERLVPGRPEGDTRVRVSVIDNGPGIPEEEQEKVFEKFYQIDAGHTREATGTGLGLAICRELAAILHSEIQLVSGVGRGSMFSLIMPLSLEPQSGAEGALEAKFRGSLTGGRTWS